ncbi:putative GprK-type G-protein coupled receptor protein [Ophiobolus disseminans]|uniref:Putative GprK-type G-protein coupled receptor protein n=1 Tax=Ophiobolus disseminans TaxID=1469910 RepID=A0A6A6ZZ03_9PLEO|nr:putative GprK-type G-protein coupled receptor protein [Ophiobolus disseminans]
METPGLTVYKIPPMPPNWDRVGVFYVSFCAIWTTIVVAGMSFCWYNRNLPIMRVRGLPLAFGSIIFLHLYWVLAQLTYPIGATMPIVIAYDVQYFVMGTWFPLGIALFHAANLRFLRVAKLQRQFTLPELQIPRRRSRIQSAWFNRVQNMYYTTRIMTLIITGVVIQALLTLGMWLACKKYHPSFGIPGTEIRGTTLPEQLVDLGRGWEWWPSVVWQFIWTWGVAPFLIWRAWDIRDTMGWRTQTIGACLSGLHATPMFLIASYVPAFNKVNAYFHPSQWIHLNTLFIEIFTVFIPAYQIIKLWQTRRKVTSPNQTWAPSSPSITLDTLHTTTPSSKSSSISLIEKDQILRYVHADHADGLYTLTALTRVLEEHPTPLQDFSAHHDFSGENIAFLTRAAKWKKEWCKGFEKEESHRRDMFNAALRIYIDFISTRDAEFPLNIASNQLKELEAVFEGAARVLCGNAWVETALPFAFDALPSHRSDEIEIHTGEIVDQFGPRVFEDVQMHVMDLVLTNTWPKFVREMQMQRRRSVGTGGSGGTEGVERRLGGGLRGLLCI